MRNPNGHPLVAAIVDWTMRPMLPIRERVVPHARGRILEIGFGTGLNLGHYDFDGVTSLTAIEPDPHMRARAERRIESLDRDVELVSAFADAMPFDDGSFDEVVLTFTLCTVPEPAAALAEIRRVLAPGGTLHFAEHTRSDHRPTEWVQRALDPLWARLAAGCHLTRDAAELISAAGFELEALHGHGRRPLNITPVHRGRARRTA